MVEKIFISKDDLIADIVERLLEVEAYEIVLVIPKEARVSESATNFRLLAREAEVHGKQIAVESVDDKARAFAEANNLKTAHPLFEGTEESRLFSDIVPRKKVKEEKKEKGAGKQAKKLAVTREKAKSRKQEAPAEIVPEIVPETAQEEPTGYAVSTETEGERV